MHFFASPPLSWPVNNLPAVGGNNLREQIYASGSGHSKSLGLQPQLLRALAAAVAKPAASADPLNTVAQGLDFAPELWPPVERHLGDAGIVSDDKRDPQRPGHRVDAVDVAAHDRRRQFLGRHDRQHRERELRTHVLHAREQVEGLFSAPVAKP